MGDPFSGLWSAWLPEKLGSIANRAYLRMIPKGMQATSPHRNPVLSYSYVPFFTSTSRDKKSRHSGLSALALNNFIKNSNHLAVIGLSGIR